MEKLSRSLIDELKIIRDPRKEKNKKHRLETILFISLCAVIAGAESWVAIERFGKSKKEWLAQYVDLSEGIPSHDTIGRVFCLLDPDAFQKVLLEWIRDVSQKSRGKIISIDGKSLRWSHNQSCAQKMLHLVHAWASENHLLLGEVKTDEKSNEITAIPALLKMLALEGAIVTVDAMGTQKEIAGQIHQAKGDYVMALKGNHELVHEEIQSFWVDPKLPESEYQSYETTDKGHGRLETRRYRISDQINWFAGKDEWKGLQSIGMVESERTAGEQKTVERRYYLTSLKAEAQAFAEAVRAHWSVENSLHWVLDVVFREDESRVRIGHAAENFSLLRKMALMMLKEDRFSKSSIKGKRLEAAWNSDYLGKVIFRG
ncbi:MAG: ISAs1 family transposase [Candidatus Omnitrophica bacterium]|nr:ISAs1 family transposase [Candidatus Omnitrophota bacterium]